MKFRENISYGIRVSVWGGGGGGSEYEIKSADGLTRDTQFRNV